MTKCSITNSNTKAKFTLSLVTINIHVVTITVHMMSSRTVEMENTQKTKRYKSDRLLLV